MPEVKVKGFTLVEMMMTVAVLLVFLTLALPTFNDLLQRQRMSAHVDVLRTDLQLAKELAQSPALSGGNGVSLCRSADGIACTGASWNQGWIVFIDGGILGVVDGGDTRERVRGPLSGGVTLDYLSNDPNAFIYFESGSANTTAGRTFTFCKKGEKGRILRVEVTGYITSSETLSTCP